MNLGKNLLRGSGANLLDHAVKMASVFYITPLMRHSLTDDGYGSWLLAMSLLGYFLLLDAGVSFSSARYFAVAVGSGDLRRQSAVQSEARRFLHFIGAGILVCTLVSLPVMPWIASKKLSVWEVMAPLAICGTVTAFRFAFRMPLILLRAHVRYDLLAWASIIRTLVQIVAMSWALQHGGGLVGAALVLSGAELLEFGLQTWFARRLPRMEASDLTEEEMRKTRKELLSYSNSVLLVNIGDSLRLQANPFIISRVLGVTVVPVYSVGLRLITMLEDVVNALFGGQVLSSFSQLHGAGKEDELRAQFRRVTRLTSCFSAWAVAGAVFAGRPFFQRWMGADFGGAHDVMLILAIPYALRFMQYPAQSLFYAVGMPHWQIWVNLAGGIFTVVVSLLLAPVLGLNGVVMGTALEMGIVYVFVMPWMIGKVSRIHPVRYFMEDVIWPGMKSLAVPVLYAWALSSWLTSEYPRLFVFGLGYALVFALSAPFVALDKEGRGPIWKAVSALFGR